VFFSSTEPINLATDRRLIPIPPSGGSSPVGNMGLVVDESGDDPPKGEERLVNLPRLLLAVSDSA
jgi:hypothetical protein